MNTLLLTKIMGALYRSVARVYDIMIALAGANSFSLVEKLYSRVYILIGVFMLFRMTVSFLTMLIDPDKLTDKQAGVGNMLSRIVIAIVLLISFPFLFGLTSDLQDALISPTNGSSLLLNIVPSNLDSSNISVQSVQDDESLIQYDPKSGNPEVTNGADDFTCYYTFSKVRPNLGATIVSQDYTKLTIHSFLTVRFTRTNGGQNYLEVLKKKNESFSAGEEGSGWYAYISPDRSKVYGVERYKNLAGASFTLKNGGQLVADGMGLFLDNGACPPAISGIDDDTDSNDSYEKYSANGVMKLHSVRVWNGLNSYGSFRDMIATLSIWYSQVDVANGDFGKLFAEPENEEEVLSILDNDIFLVSDISNAARKFSGSIARTFVNAYNPSGALSKDELDEINKKLDRISLSPVADNEIEDLEDDGYASVDHILGYVVGIVVFIVLVTVCIDVVVRNFKLLLLEAIAPVPAISYINPNDKMLSTWFKQFIGCYLNLFITILAISLSVYFGNTMLNSLSDTSNFFMKLMVVMGMITFMKIVPGFISKIFGISDMAGTFKDSFKMLKTGAGIAAGGAIAGGFALAAGAKTAYYAGKNTGWRNAFGSIGQGLGTTLGAVVRGAKGGAKGKFGEGRRYASEVNNRRSNLYRSGIGFGAQVFEPIAGKVGMDTVSRTDRGIQQMKEDNESYKLVSSLKDGADNIIKSSDFYKNVIGRRDAKGNTIFQSEEQKNMMADWADLQVKYKKQIDSGRMSKSQASSQMANDFLTKYNTLLFNRGVIDLDGKDTATGEDFKMNYEVGRADGVYQHFERMSALLEHNSTLKKDFGATYSSGIHSYQDMKNLEGQAKSKFSANETAIYNATTGNSKYNVSKAVQENGGNGNKKS